MDCKVCTKCNENKKLEEFTKGKAACKRCVYDLYTRPSVLKRLERQGKLPKELHPRKTEDEKRLVRNQVAKRAAAKKKSETPPKLPKEQWATKPPKIKLSPEEKKLRKKLSKKKYIQENPDKIAAEKKRRYDRVKNDPHFKVAKNIRKRLKKLLKNANIGAFSGMVGCTKDELVKHLEGQFTEGMTWENYGINGWHIDHIRPLASFDLLDSTTWKEANHYTNLQPIWKDENHAKSSEWEGVRWAKGKPVTDKCDS